MASGDQIEQRLNDIYYNAGDPGGYGGGEGLLRPARAGGGRGAAPPAIPAGVSCVIEMSFSRCSSLSSEAIAV